MQNYYQQFDTCRERDIPSCADACPFRLDILTIQERIAKGRFNAAYKSIRDCVVFPGIVSELCPAYCEKECIRKIIDTPVQLKYLEKAVIANAKRKDPNRYNLPARKQRVAVIGAGLAGMGFAFRMASKKYQVTIFEKSDRIGGHLAELMDEDAYMAEFDLQFKNEKYELQLGVNIDDISALCDDFDIIYAATGKGGDTFGVPLPDSDGGGCMLIGDTAVFIGGEVCGRDLMHALADSINISAAAESFLKTKKIEYPSPGEPTRCVADEDRLIPSPAVITEGSAMTEDDCIAEAGRCIRCRCDACSSQCDLVDYFEKTPTKMRDEIFLSCKPAGSLVHKSPARKYVAACTMCGLMTEACPEHIDLCGMVKYARHKMHEADKVPAAYRQYFMRDMAFANSEYAAVKRAGISGSDATASGCAASAGQAAAIGTDADVKYAFFPGCNLGALNPDYVIKPYKWLLSRQPDTAMLLRCCSIPVDWNGDSVLHNKEIDNLRQDWMDLGKPVMIMACMSCQKHLREYLPEIETVSLYELLEQWDFVPGDITAGAEGRDTEDGSETFAVFDPCAARNEQNVQASVRNLISSCGINASELPKGDKHGCCGFGGMGSIASPGFAEHIADMRCELSDEPYIVYCSNCRDIFCDRGKKAVHILDVLFAIDPECTRPQPDLTQRRINRVTLKKRLLEEIWKEEPEMKSYKSEFPLIMEDEVRKKVNRQHILEEDICAVISNAEATGRRAFDPATGHYKAYREIGHITCWVEYIPLAAEGSYEVFNTYTHRMKIELEAIWNGRKTEAHM